MSIPSKRSSHELDVDHGSKDDDDVNMDQPIARRSNRISNQDTSATYALTVDDLASNLHSKGNDGSNANSTAAVLQLLNLKPLRDLARNFDIDIASCLNDYLNELDHEVFNTTSTQPSLSQDENENASALLPNFAQAALLLQNSSGVYSRKVEYLHSLVYKTLHSLIDQTNKHNQSKVKSKNRGDEDIFQFQEFDPDLQFLLLDDVLPIDKDGTKINLKQKEGDEERAVRVDGALQLLEKDNKNANDTDSVNNNNSTVLNTTRLSIGVVIDDQHDSANAAKDAAGNTFNTTLRLMHGACQIHSGTGALLMPGTTTEVTTMESLFQKQNHVYDNNKPMAMDVSMDNGCVGMDDENGGIGFDANGDIDDDYDEDDGNGFVLNQENDAPYSENEQVENQKLNEAASELQDPWKLLLDPHDNSNSKFRPVKVGNTIRLPHDCDELPSDSVTGAGSKRSRKRKKTSSADTKAQAQVEWWDKCIATHSYSTTVAALKKEISAKKRGEDEDDMDSVVDSSSQLFLPLPLQGHLFGNEFLYVAKHQQALKAAQKRKEKQHSNERKGIMAGISEAEVTNERFRDMYEGDDNYEEDGYVDFNYGGADYDDDDDEGANNGVDQRFDNFDEVFSSHDANGDVESKQSTFEELCRAHLRDFAKDAENYAIETGLTKRVSDWQSRLSVILEEEDARPEFNISAYSDRIIAKVDREMKSSRKKKSLGKQKNDTINFVSITKNLHPFDVSRTFLATLMLCNSENVVFCGDEDENGVSSPDSLRLKLLKLDLNSPMENYLAPSVTSRQIVS